MAPLMQPLASAPGIDAIDIAATQAAAKIIFMKGVSGYEVRDNAAAAPGFRRSFIAGCDHGASAAGAAPGSKDRHDVAAAVPNPVIRMRSRASLLTGIPFLIAPPPTASAWRNKLKASKLVLSGQFQMQGCGTASHYPLALAS